MKQPNRSELSIYSFLMLLIQERKLLKENGFTVKQLEPCWYYPEQTANLLVSQSQKIGTLTIEKEKKDIGEELIPGSDL